MRLLRLITGLVIASFVAGHFVNHSLGVVSIEAMDRMRFMLAVWWRSPVGTFLLYGCLLTHFSLALISLYRRSTLRMPFWEGAQLALGLAIPPLLIAHIVGTRFTWTLLGHNIDYERIVGLIWSSEWSTAKQVLLLLVVWGHVCAGLHYWLRLRQWYQNALPLGFAMALLLPALALAGFASAGFTLWPSVESVGGIHKYNVDLAGMTARDRALIAHWRDGLEYGFWIALGATLLARWLRTRIGGTYRLRHASGRVINAPVGRVTQPVGAATRDCRTRRSAAAARAARPAGCASATAWRTCRRPGAWKRRRSAASRRQRTCASRASAARRATSR